MSCSFSRIREKAFEDMDDPFQSYNPSGEPVEDRLRMPCGGDPDKNELGIAFVHPFPQHHWVREQRKIKNVDFSAAQWLMAKGKEVADPFSATPIDGFEATNELWLPLRRDLPSQRWATATVSALQTNHGRQTKVRQSQNDWIDAMNSAKVFKAGESHATRMPPPTRCCLRESSRTHF
ncbi:hypothetical protein HYR99_15265 [Candidatus Poribacteria bacterium]|nr:hypothetical protein [Candidatus Poribacteria bacterium]